MNNNVQEIAISFLKSNWPKTEKLAEELFNIGSDEAKKALLDGLKGKRHIIRTASIRYLAMFNDKNMVEVIRPFLADASFETRIEAKKAIKALTGKDVLTVRGE